MLDASGRLLIPKRLLDFAGVKDEVLLAGRDGKIDVWSPAQYEKFDELLPDLGSLTKRILGGDIRLLDEE
jgi:MraZ protein